MSRLRRVGDAADLYPISAAVITKELSCSVVSKPSATTGAEELPWKFH